MPLWKRPEGKEVLPGATQDDGGPAARRPHPGHCRWHPRPLADNSAPPPVPAAVKQRYDDLVAKQTAKTVIPFESGIIQSGNTVIDTGPGTLTLTTEDTHAATTPETPAAATDPPVA